jgi:hypothetical protein
MPELLPARRLTNLASPPDLILVVWGCSLLTQRAISVVSMNTRVNAAEVPLDGRFFRGAEMAEAGEASAATVFEYHEDDGVVWARYEGGAVRLGFLVGTREGQKLDFRYSQLNTQGKTANGHCSTKISVLPDGRVRLDEDWAWESKPGAGTSAVEEQA